MTERKPLSISVLAYELDTMDSDDKCTNLSADQIEMINGILKRNEKGTAICSCDVQRVLDMCKESEVK